MGTGEVDVVIENWGHADLMTKYIDEARRGGRPRAANGNDRHHRLVRAAVARRGVPRHHRLGEPQQVRRRTSPPQRPGTRGSCSTATRRSSPTTRRWSRTSGSNFEVVYAGSEAALIQAFRKAEANQEWLHRLLLRAAVVPLRGAAGQGRPSAVRRGLRRRSRDGRLRLPASTPSTRSEPRLRRGGRAGRKLWSRTSPGPTTTRTRSRWPSPRTAWLLRTPRSSGSTPTRTRSIAWLEGTGASPSG